MITARYNEYIEVNANRGHIFFHERQPMKKYSIKIKISGELPRKIKKAADVISADVDSILERDPAAKNKAEVLLLYSGVHALLLYRLAHMLNNSGLELTSRTISQFAKFLTGIEIHPAARIGKGLFIDHGSGVVIGETAVIGDYCTIYQGATLGGTGKQNGKRHPTLGNNVMVGAGAKVLGNFTVGDNSKIAAGAVVLCEVPPDSTAVGIPAHVVVRNGERVADSAKAEKNASGIPSSCECPAEHNVTCGDEVCGCGTDLDQIHIPDPIENEISELREKIALMQKSIDSLTQGE